MKRIFHFLSIFMALFILVGNVSAEEELNKAAKKLAKKKLVERVRPGADLKLAENEKIIVLPADIWMTGDEKKYSMSLFGGIIAGFGDKAISLEPLKTPLEKAGLGDISRRLSWATWHMVSWHGSFDFLEDAGYHGGSSDYAALVDAVATILNLAMEKLEIDAEIKYVVFTSVRNSSVAKAKAKLGMFGIECLGAMYNVKEKKVDKVFRKKMVGGGKTEDQKEKFRMGSMVKLGKTLPEVLLNAEENEE